MYSFYGIVGISIREGCCRRSGGRECSVPKGCLPDGQAAVIKGG